MRRFSARQLLVAALLALGFGPLPAPGAAAEVELLDNGAVVLMYHRFGESDLPTTSVTLQQFEAHLAELTSGGYHVLALPEIVAALHNGRRLPERSVAITVDDAFLSVYIEAWPRLRAAGLPFTLFVATDPVDRELPRYMTWKQLRELAADPLVTIGAHTASHPHMVEASAEGNREEIRRSLARFERELGTRPALFAYPFGEFSQQVADLVAAMGFAAAFGQHSGVIARSLDRFRLPRFGFNEAYGDIERFRLVVNAAPLPVTDLTPADPQISEDSNPPLLGFTVLGDFAARRHLNCYASNGLEAQVEQLEARVEVRLSGPLPTGRTRINCTMPASDGRWRWFGRQLYLPER
jgi:peptidoglycan/xylan/chitin deacetylase (PgdA/CDA1 family)